MRTWERKKMKRFIVEKKIWRSKIDSWRKFKSKEHHFIHVAFKCHLEPYCKVNGETKTSRWALKEAVALQIISGRISIDVQVWKNMDEYEQREREGFLLVTNRKKFIKASTKDRTNRRYLPEVSENWPYCVT